MRRRPAASLVVALVLAGCSGANRAATSSPPRASPVPSFSPIRSPAASAQPSATPPTLAMEPAGLPPDGSPFAVWPEDTADAARAAEARREPWRADPAEVARRFGAEVLGWVGADVVLRAGERCRYPCADVLRAPGDPAGAIVELVRVFPDLWSVVAVRRLGHAGAEQHVYAVDVRAGTVHAGFDDAEPLTIEFTVVFGGTVRTGRATSDEVTLDLPGTPETTGHYLVRYLDADGSVVGAEARALSSGESATGN